MNGDGNPTGTPEDDDHTPPNLPDPPPTLKPFLDNLPSPSSLRSNNPTPTPRTLHPDAVGHDGDVLTPTRASFDLGENKKGDDDEEAQDAEDGEGSQVKQEGEEESEDEDAEFQSHYSRQSSPATSNDSGSELEQPTELFNSTINRDEDGLNPVHRVNSMPASATTSHHPPPLIHSHSYSNIHPIHPSRSSASLSRGPPPLPPPLYPPFYNKPPNPLPPSPSLTSLLRPPSLLALSIPSTRPTSPESSDLDTPHDTEAQITTSARRTTPLPPTAPKVPTYEYYGFVLYLASSLAFLMYILWAYLPSPFLHALGVTYYPDRWWALAIPAWIVMALCFVYVALAAYNIEFLTLPLDRVETMVDEAGNVAILDENGRIRKGGSKRFVKEYEERQRNAHHHRHQHRRHHQHQHRKGSISGGGGGATGGGGGGKSSKKKKEREREKNAKQDWYGYTGAFTETGDVASGLSWGRIWNEGTDAVMDVPLGGVCEVLYGREREWEGF